MAKKFRYCIHCRRTFTESEIGRGNYVKTRYGLLCLECARKLEEPAEVPSTQEKQTEAASSTPVLSPPASPEKASPAPAQPAKAGPDLSHEPAEIGRVLSDISRQVEAIHRLLTFEKSSIWNVLGAVAQCLAAGLLVLALATWLENPITLLLAALLVQMMALTFFVKGK